MPIVAVVPADTPSMAPQCFCSLPWCGKGFAPNGPTKRFKVDGAWLEYPEGMDFHHANGGHSGPGLYICHDCHMHHHHVEAYHIAYDERWMAARQGEALRPCVEANPWD